jgi:hypothetical protein
MNIQVEGLYEYKLAKLLTSKRILYSGDSFVYIITLWDPQARNSYSRTLPLVSSKAGASPAGSTPKNLGINQGFLVPAPRGCGELQQIQILLLQS